MLELHTAAVTASHRSIRRSHAAAAAGATADAVNEDAADWDFDGYRTPHKRAMAAVVADKEIGEAGKKEEEKDWKEGEEGEDDAELRCNICGKLCGNAGALVMHLRRHEEVDEGGDEKLCPECGFTYGSASALAKHMRHAHAQVGEEEEEEEKGDNSDAGLRCSVCHKQCGNTGALVNHMRSHEEDEEEEAAALAERGREGSATSAPRQCRLCGTTQTTKWRCSNTLCNKCGLKRPGEGKALEECEGPARGAKSKRVQGLGGGAQVARKQCGTAGCILVSRGRTQPPSTPP